MEMRIRRSHGNRQIREDEQHRRGSDRELERNQNHRGKKGELNEQGPPRRASDASGGKAHRSVKIGEKHEQDGDHRVPEGDDGGQRQHHREECEGDHEGEDPVIPGKAGSTVGGRPMPPGSVVALDYSEGRSPQIQHRSGEGSVKFAPSSAMTNREATVRVGSRFGSRTTGEVETRETHQDQGTAGSTRFWSRKSLNLYCDR